MMTQLTVDQVLELAGVTYSEIAVAQHQEGYIHIIVQTDGDGIVTDASTTETEDGYYRNDEWTSIYRYGTGSVPCNCDACSAGDDPAEWAGDDVDGIEDEIQRGIDELTKCR